MSLRRVDIQALRGIAVLYVVIYHAGLGFLKNGFLGVDVFFVISGYLITGMICRGINSGEFRIGEFYWRRAKRLLPATYCTLFLTAILSVFSLTQAELSSFVSQLLGSMALISNVVLWQQVGYFDVATQLKPLLHMWSLSVEEQFYLLLPAFLIFSPARHRTLIVLSLTGASLVACFVFVVDHPFASFYLLPMRAWELLIGSTGAVLRRPHLGPGTERNIGLLSVAIILLLPACGIDTVYPRLDALLICLATLAALWTSPAVLRTGPLPLALAKVGDISFSLYLIHWPLFALARNTYLGPLPTSLKLTLTLVAVALATLQYWLVENPLHRSRLRPTREIAGVICFGTILIVAIPAARMTATFHGTDWAEYRKPVTGLDDRCDFKGAFRPLAECRTSAHPKIAVWGDSFAMHLIPGMRATDPGFGLMQATRATCGPFFSVAPTIGPGFPPKTCLTFTETFRAYLAEAPEIQYVVISSPFAQYIFTKALVLDTGENIAPTRQAAAQYLGRTILTLREMGKKVTIVAPPPHDRFDLGFCSEHIKSGLWTWNAPPDCEIDIKHYHQGEAVVIAMLEEVSQTYDVSVIWPSDYLCNQETCHTFYNGVALYRDEGHFSYSGSEMIFKNFDLFSKIIDAAR